jgi:hypothetical protein
MNCRDCKTEIALHVGHDEVDPDRWEEVRRHVSTCVSCRVHYKRMKSALGVLEQADAASTYETRDSLWPELSARLDAPPPRKGPRDRGRWLPYASFAVACLLFIVIWGFQPQAEVNPMGPPTFRGISPLPELSPGSPGSDRWERTRPEQEPEMEEGADDPPGGESSTSPFRDGDRADATRTGRWRN